MCTLRLSWNSGLQEVLIMSWMGTLPGPSMLAIVEFLFACSPHLPSPWRWRRSSRQLVALRDGGRERSHINADSDNPGGD